MSLSDAILKKIEEKIDAKPKAITRPKAKGLVRNALGRPKGSSNGDRKGKRWEPRKWRPDYEIMVLMSCSGKTNKEIAESFNRSEMFISLILNCTKGQEVFERVRLNLPVKGITDRYDRLLDKSLERVEDYIYDDSVYQANRGGMVDRSMKLMEMIDSRLKLNKPIEKLTERTLVLASETTINKLLTAMERSNEVTAKFRINKTEEVNQTVGTDKE